MFRLWWVIYLVLLFYILFLSKFLHVLRCGICFGQVFYLQLQERALCSIVGSAPWCLAWVTPCVSFWVLLETNLGIFIEGNCHYLHQPSTWGNQRGELTNSTITSLRSPSLGTTTLSSNNTVGGIDNSSELVGSKVICFVCRSTSSARTPVVSIVESYWFDTQP